MSISTARRIAVVAALACSALFATTAARASNIHWSVGISAPLYPGEVSTVISNGPYYAPPPPVYLRPAPVYYYAPPPVYYRPVPVVVHRGAPYPGYWHQRQYQDRWHDRRDRWQDRRGRHDDDGNHRNRNDGWRR